MDVERLLIQVGAITKKYEGIAKVTGESFNIFKILKVESSEVRTHSAFLAELLNPLGSHGQGDTFLRSFIEKFRITGFENIETISAEVKVEAVGKFGRIDILITPRVGKTIIIENKIYASDQNNQLIRYKNENKDCHLLYLTLDGKLPSAISIEDQSTGQRLKHGTDYFTISYKDDVIDWLVNCRKEAANHPILRETISQYINLIKHLTNQTMNEQTKLEIVQTVLSNPENIKSAENIAGSWDAIRLKIIEHLKPSIISISIQLGLIVKIDNDVPLGKNRSGFWFYKEGWKFCIYFCFNRDFDDILVGVHTLDSKTKNDLVLKEVIKERLKNAEFGKILNFENWMWVSDFGIWDDTAWKDIESKIPDAIQKAVSKILENLDGIQL